MPEGNEEIQKSPSELCHPDAEGFKEKVTPKNIDDADNIFILECTCGHTHFRHAGYLQMVLPYVSSEGKRVSKDTHQVMVCIKCKKCYVWVGSQFYDVNSKVDLKAWDEAERELNEATGPGGEC